MLDILVRLCGGDPAVFRPVAHAHALILRRRARLVQTKRGLLTGASPFRILCFFAAMYGLTGAFFVNATPSRVLGAGLAVTLGCGFLLMVVMMDDLDVLVNPREYLVLAAHPHDDRSFLLAKIFVVGRSLAILSVILFVPPALAISSATHSAVAGLLDLTGAAAAGAAGSTAAMFLGAAVLSLGGRRAMDRLLPWFQVLFQFFFLIFMGGRMITRLLSSTSVPQWVAWALPSFWFMAPFQAWIEDWNRGVTLRTLLAAGTLVALSVGGFRFLGAHVGERLLEPIETKRPSSARQSRSRRGWRVSALLPGEENRRLFNLLLVHLRSDWRTRAEFLTMPVVALVLVFQLSSGGAAALSPTISIGFLGWFLVLSLDVLTRSSRPSSIWYILVSPVDRLRLSLGTVTVVRVFQLAPIALLLLVVELARDARPGPEVFLNAVEFYLFGDLLILVGRCLFPEFPFSRPSRMEGEAGGRRTLVIFAGGLISGAGVLLLWLARRAGVAGEWVAVFLLLTLRFPAAAWMRRRVGDAAESLELAALASG